ncbi:TrmH family RNA methyltransferase [Microbacterium sp. 22303]|uniref:TrmH family RNA methyltransferase n=1 Tax=Microbacterium sp. 22303 TaxID=3453905 RepID=UPI003F873A62
MQDPEVVGESEPTPESTAAPEPARAPEPAPESTAAPEPARAPEPAPEPEPTHGVGPWEGEWPAEDRLDPELLANGDRRNVVDRYRYWRMEAIVADLDTRRHGFHVAIENWQHDMNIGSIVRSANAFLADTVHIIGRRRWNRRGAMVTDRYQHVMHHDTVQAFTAWAEAERIPIIAVDNLDGAVPVDRADLPERCVLLFGAEGPGLSDEALAAASGHVEITQYGSTRSINAGAAAAVIMYEWCRRHAG